MPPWRRGPPLPGRVTVSNVRGSDQKPHAVPALAWLSRVAGAVNVEPLHLPHASCSRTGAIARTPSSTDTSRPVVIRCSIAFLLKPSSTSCSLDTRLNCLRASSAKRASLITSYREQSATFAPWRGVASVTDTERVGFERTRRFDPPTRFPVAHLKPLGHLSGRLKIAARRA